MLIVIRYAKEIKIFECLRVRGVMLILKRVLRVDELNPSQIRSWLEMKKKIISISRSKLS